MIPSFDFISECFDCNQDTGVLVWKVRPRIHFATARGWNGFNARFAGMEAGAPHSNGYLAVSLSGKKYFAHRLVKLLSSGEWPLEQVDHINGIKTDNRISNLRESTHSENLMNQKLRRDSSSGVKGVNWSENLKRWGASIQISGKRHYLGYFQTIELAAKCVQEARKIHHGVFANHGTALA